MAKILQAMLKTIKNKLLLTHYSIKFAEMLSYFNSLAAIIIIILYKYNGSKQIQENKFHVSIEKKTNDKHFYGD